MTFDQIYNDEERQTTMADHRAALSKSKVRSVKKKQIKASIRSIETNLKWAKSSYIESLTKNADSVALRLEVDKLEEQLRMANDMYAALFYGRFRRLIIKIFRWISRK